MLRVSSLKVILSKRKYNTSLRDLNTFISSQVEQVEKWWGSPRFEDIKRPYKAIDVAKHRGSMSVEDCKYPSSVQARKLFQMVDEKFDKGEPLHTLGVLDPVQMTQLAKCKDIGVVYASGWACSSTMVGSTNEVSPDFGDYPYDTVPRQVERIFKAQQLHDRKATLDSFENRTEFVDYMKPIIADGDMGHGGLTTVMKVAKLFAEKGAAAVHLEDQLPGGKRCGHLGGAVLVPTSTHLSRLIATRFQWDIMGTENMVIARTDSCNSKLLSSNSDPRDHAFIKGVIGKDIIPWSEVLTDLELSGTSRNVIAEAEREWYDKNKIYTFDEAIALKLTSEEVGKYTSLLQQYKEDNSNREYLSLRERQLLVRQAAPTKEIIFNWDAPKTKEGYYMYNGCLESALQRSKTFAPYSDMLWLETKTPNLKQAQTFARDIHEAYSNSKLVYNLSPSFNWEAQGFSPEQLKSFIWDLSKEGFVLQLVSLSGLHINAVSFWELAQKFQRDGMHAYVDLVQNKENSLKCDVLTHQRWSGAEYIDSMMNVLQNGSSSQTLSTSGESYTEDQFNK